ncbi:MAG: MBL fold metallo-hydrolase [Erysipelotrichaceae bacterium]|nr:MBL fold metallo-hydrolase [Erysipelotrichaceae bacterium]
MEWEAVRKQYENFREVKQSQAWFKVYDIGHDILAIYEPYHFQEVISYLILGEEKALLWDTGLGIGDMKKCVEEIYDGDYLVVNSHHHFDHIGDDWRFEKVYVYDHPDMIRSLEGPLADSYVKPQFEEDQFADEAPIRSHTYVYHPVTYETVKEGHLFDLGKRRWKLIHTPGHAKDAVMLVNEEEKILFTGDTYYPAPLYCFEDTFEDYVKTMKKLSGEYSSYLLVTSHNEPYAEGSILKDIAEGFEKILLREVKPDKDLGEREMYIFDSFSLIKKKEERI